MNLYLVETRGYGDYHFVYVVAGDPTTAYLLVKQYLDKNDLCFISDRVLKKIELIAESAKYPSCKTMLLLGIKGAEAITSSTIV